MKKIYLPVLVMLFIAGVVRASAGGKKIEETGSEQSKKAGPEVTKKIIIAKVNGAGITMDSLVRMMNRISAQSKGAASDPGQDTDRLRKQAMDRLVLQELAWQKAQTAGLHAKPENVESALANLRTNMGGEEGFRKFLEREQTTEKELRQLVTRSLTLEIVYAQEVYRKVTVPEDDLRREYEREKARFIKAETMSVTDVYFPSKEGSTGLQKKANAVREKILLDKNRDPWMVPLDGTFDVRTYEPRIEKDSEMIAEARKMKANDISGVIKAADGFHIIKLREYSPERQMAFDEVRGYLENKLRITAQDKRLREWEQELRKNAVIEIMSSSEREKKS